MSYRISFWSCSIDDLTNKSKSVQSIRPMWPRFCLDRFSAIFTIQANEIGRYLSSDCFRIELPPPARRNVVAFVQRRVSYAHRHRYGVVPFGTCDRRRSTGCILLFFANENGVSVYDFGPRDGTVWVTTRALPGPLFRTRDPCRETLGFRGT